MARLSARAPNVFRRPGIALRGASLGIRVTALTERRGFEWAADAVARSRGRYTPQVPETLDREWGVSLKTDAYYRTVADEALRHTGVVEPPIGMEAVARRLGLPVRLVHLPAFFSAAAINEDGMPVLVLNSALEEAGRRRHLAHLLGHVLAVLDDPQATYPRDGRPDHHEADVIASELLLPSWIVVEQAAKWFNDQRYLARLFGVTEAEMLSKMRELGLVKSRGLVWDY